MTYQPSSKKGQFMHMGLYWDCTHVYHLTNKNRINYACTVYY